MKSIICILALLCTVYAWNFNLRKCEVLMNKQKKVISIQLSNLSRFEELMKKDKEVKLNEIKTGASGKVNDIINGALEKVKLCVDEAKLVGKDAEECYNDANNTLDTEETNAVIKLETCIQNGHKIMEDSLENVANDIEAVKEIQADLEAMKDCDMMKLIQNTISLKRIGYNIKKGIVTATRVAYPKMITAVKICTTKIVVNIHNSSTNIVTDTQYCIEAIEPSDDITTTPDDTDTSSDDA
jgi:hypothetical protein